MEQNLVYCSFKSWFAKSKFSPFCDYDIITDHG